MADHTLDMCGFACPMPILKTKQALASMESKEIIEVICTDQGSKKDFVAFCNQLGHKLISQKDDGNKIIFNIEKN
ncbi:sulfurtransferase TusA family protein [Candidatus Pseudothioglobus singularis]|jgi:tRNA 2-thiouridine synthesizing protein A|uniref:Response regulator SirA n=1 Tax=Candidatus Pseudothioglobus singularis PS1 TaxID=1125411 RepID=A0A0M3T1P6_9GAMM|nr:sulfurtransferase TusA family protein [Candidatus Pseudothioglobus singularis]MDA9642198.1 sulfurtransferase TusA family protein [Candidatus Thioglobus sp.]ALE01441.1 response regulator SirA [Candidatus Pseudothioglobus singularis PS1]ANQ66106.1 SirA family protein [Candidatus Pseudothioglobus singularis]MDA7437765.1 sulfurtransferase TusA family protein [Candidatus Pseudothioglobus singularis]MDA7440859.1 sulfurtransferase TusA family protein [Candidatus Pseudothioglobus singularis]|tara:strand:- start:162 stop:386 length:225 start_codon:yes stop_codon:yes gene_type:complete